MGCATLKTDAAKYDDGATHLSVTIYAPSSSCVTSSLPSLPLVCVVSESGSLHTYACVCVYECIGIEVRLLGCDISLLTLSLSRAWLFFI